MMTKMFNISTFAALLTMTDAGPTWTPSVDDFARRLEKVTAKSHPSSTDAGCIVGGFDVANPAKVFVGGPCSELGSDNTPKDNFRWIEMETAHFTLRKGEASASLKLYGGGNRHHLDKTTHVEDGVSVTAHIVSETVNHAAVLVSTTSYLTQASMDFNENTFVVGTDNNTGELQTLDICVAKCCASPGTGGCSCSSTTCPTTNQVSASPGDYKYSIMVEAFDDASTDVSPSNNYVAGASGNGWERIVQDWGTGSPTQLTDTFLDTYQVIDFTNMGEGTLTVTATDGTSVLYSAMVPCYLMASSPSCTHYSVNSMAFASPNLEWEGTYAFPQTYNRGDWAVSGGSFSSTPGNTNMVSIRCVRPDATTLTAVGMNSTNKVVFLEYSFDITGVTATQFGGKYMVYDPTVTTTAEDGTSLQQNQKQIVSGAHGYYGIASLALAIVFVACQISE